MSANTNAPATTMPAERKRGPLTLDRPVKNTLTGSTVVQAKRSPQVHVLPAGATRTLCNIDTSKWADSTTIEDGKITCPVCAKALKAATAKAAGPNITEPAPAKQTRGRKLKAETAEPQLADAVAESDAVVS